MKNYSILFILLSFCLLPTAQSQKHDNFWLLGQGFSNTRSIISYLDFSFNPPQIDTLSIPKKFDLSFTNASISDEYGKLQCVSSGCSILNDDAEFIANSDSLNPGDGSGYCADYGFFELHQGLLFLPFPAHPGQYILVHPNTRKREKYPDELLYTIIDMNQNGGAGRVTKKNERVYQNNLSDMLTAVKHGNGRDWWVVVPQRESNTYCIFLVSPEGVSQPILQTIGSYQMGDFVSPAVFSPDGTLYARTNFVQGIAQVLYFDRCTGVFCCPSDLQFPVTHPGKNGSSGAAFSPNSRLLYVSTTTELFQYDMRARKIAPFKVADYDGFKTSFAATFYQQRLAPDGKIYMCCSNGINVVHVIHAPDRFGIACNFRQHDILLPKTYGVTLPNFPFYRLYDLQGSVCDTLGINTPSPEESLTWSISQETLRAWPNPSSTEMTLSIPPQVSDPLRIYDVMGRLVYELPFIRGGATLTLDVSTYPAGVYYATILDYKTFRHTTRLVVARGRD